MNEILDEYVILFLFFIFIFIILNNIYLTKVHTLFVCITTISDTK